MHCNKQLREIEINLITFENTRDQRILEKVFKVFISINHTPIYIYIRII